MRVYFPETWSLGVAYFLTLSIHRTVGSMADVYYTSYWQGFSFLIFSEFHMESLKFTIAACTTWITDIVASIKLCGRRTVKRNIELKLEWT